MTGPSRLLRVAYHEAGHVVTAFFLGRSIRSVTVVPSADSLGLTRHWPTPTLRPDVDNSSPKARARLEDEIVIFLAGPFAEKRLAGRSDHVGARFDYKRAVDMATYCTSSDRSANALIRWRTIVAEDFVEHHWTRIEDLARELAEKRTLSGRQIKEFMGWAPAPKVA